MKSTRCKCGQEKTPPWDIACRACLAKIEPAIVAEYRHKDETKRGAPSYHVARRALIRALDRVTP